MGYFLNPALVERAADYARSQGRPSAIAGLVLLLNSIHASATTGGEVGVSQAYLARLSGGLSARWVRAGETDLLAAGLVRRAPDRGRRRILVLVEAQEILEEGRRGVIHKFSTTIVENSTPTPDTGTPVPVSSGTPVPLSGRFAYTDRARVQKEREIEKSGAPAELLTLRRELSSLASAVGAGRPQAQALAQIGLDLRLAVGLEETVRAIRDVGAWTLRTARRAPAALAVQALRARVSHARAPRLTQRSLYPPRPLERLPEA